MHRLSFPSSNTTTPNSFGAGAPRRSSLPVDFANRIQQSQKPLEERAALMQELHTKESSGKLSLSDGMTDRASLTSTVENIPSPEELTQDGESARNILGNFFGFNYTADRSELCAEAYNIANTDSTQIETAFTKHNFSPVEVLFYRLCEIVSAENTQPEEKRALVSAALADHLDAYAQQLLPSEVPNTEDHQGVAETIALQQKLLQQDQSLSPEARKKSLANLVPIATHNELVDYL